MDALKIDWLRFTIPAEVMSKYTNIHDAVRDWKLAPMLDYDPEYRHKGHIGWTFSMSPLPHVIIAAGGQSGTGCIDLSASGLEVLAHHLDKYVPAITVQEWIVFMVEKFGARASRIDLAFDDTSGVLNLDDVYDALQWGNVVTHYKTMRQVGDRDIGDVMSEWKHGRTIYLGKRTSESFIRFYDKAAEQGKEGEHWIRCEMQLNRGTANNYLTEWIAQGFVHSLALGYLRSKVEFIDPHQTDTNASRAKPAEWWATFCQSVVKAGIKAPDKEVRTFEQALEWLETSAAPTMGLVLLAFGEEVLMNMATEGSLRLNRDQRYMLDMFDPDKWKLGKPQPAFDWDSITATV